MRAISAGTASLHPGDRASASGTPAQNCGRDQAAAAGAPEALDPDAPVGLAEVRGGSLPATSSTFLSTNLSIPRLILHDLIASIARTALTEEGLKLCPGVGGILFAREEVIWVSPCVLTCLVAATAMIIWSCFGATVCDM